MDNDAQYEGKTIGYHLDQMHKALKRLQATQRGPELKEALRAYRGAIKVAIDDLRAERASAGISPLTTSALRVLEEAYDNGKT